MTWTGEDSRRGVVADAGVSSVGVLCGCAQLMRVCPRCLLLCFCGMVDFSRISAVICGGRPHTTGTAPQGSEQAKGDRSEKTQLAPYHPLFSPNTTMRDSNFEQAQ